jgi:hypothetical protein
VDLCVSRTTERLGALSIGSPPRMTAPTSRYWPRLYEIRINSRRNEASAEAGRICTPERAMCRGAEPGRLLVLECERSPLLRDRDHIVGGHVCRIHELHLRVRTGDAAKV